ncbi:MAG: hypothetical protein ACHQ4H_03010 [Ktedonobacterales bacterium]
MKDIHVQQRYLAAGLLAVCCLALVSSATAARLLARPVPARLDCPVAVATNPPPKIVDTVTSALTCSVTGANHADTSFAVKYKLYTTDGATNRFLLVCSGALRHGTGSCVRPFYVPFPFAPSESWAAGTALPSGNTLGPIIPAPLGPSVTT